jgi:hypothetical protein
MVSGKQFFAKMTGKTSRSRSSNFAFLQISKARVQRTAFECAGKGADVDRQLGVIAI